MIGAYCTDSIKIITVRTDSFGSKTELESVEINARVTDYNRLVRNKTGQEVTASILISIDKNEMTAKGVTITTHDKIKITKRNGTAYEMADKKWDIIILHDASSFASEYWKVTL